MAVQAAKLQKQKNKEEEEAKGPELSYFTKQRNKLSKRLLDSQHGKQFVETIEQQGEMGVNIAEEVRERAEKHKMYELSQMDAGELARIEMDKLKSRFNAGLPIPDHGSGELHDAVRMGQNNKVTQLLSHSYDVDQIDKRTGYTALMVAAKNSNNESARLLLESGAEVRYQNRRGGTALHFACKGGEGKITRLILDRAYQCRCVKILMDIRDTDGRTARELAQGRGESHLVAKMDAAVKEEAAVKQVEDTLQHIDVEAEEVYLSHGFRNGSTALHWLMESGNMDFFSPDRRQQAARGVKKLVLLGADVNDGDSAGRRPLHYAAMSIGGGGPDGIPGGCPNTFCARSLFRACEDPPVQVDIDVKDDMGMTAMTYAVERGAIDFCELLLKRGADIHYVLHPSGYTYLHVCAQRNYGEGCDGVYGEMGEWLVESEVDHNVVDDYGRTCRMLAEDVGKRGSRFVLAMKKAEDDERQRKYRVKALVAGRQYKK